MNVSNELKVYAFISSNFIISKIPNWLEKINSVILFGSIAQNRADKDSDVDLFFDTNISEKQKVKLRSEIRNIVSDFRLSQDALKFKMKGIANEISFSIGKLSEWEDLEKSIASTGIILYGKYQTEAKNALKHNMLVFWENVGKNRGAFLNKMYGYTIKEKKYKGFIEKCKGTKIGKSAAMIPIEYKGDFYKMAENYKVNYKILEVFRY